MSLESLLLHETLEAHVALVGPYIGVDEDVTLHVGQQGELTTTDATLMLLHPLEKEKKGGKLHQERRVCVFLLIEVKIKGWVYLKFKFI